MSDAAEQLLSREEVAAILEEVASGEGEAQMGRRGTAIQPSTLLRPLKVFAEEQGRVLSTEHQRPIALSLIRFESLPASQLVETLRADDLAVALDFGPTLGRSLLVVGRSLFFGWMTLAFGGRTSNGVLVPEREYTRIEDRFLLRIGSEIAEQLAAAFGSRVPHGVRAADALDRELSHQLSPPRSMVAAFAVEGFGESGRLRIGLPLELVAAEQGTTGAAVAKPAPELREGLLYSLVELRAEIGSVDLPIRQVVALKEGDVIPLGVDRHSEVLLRIEDEAKFRGVRGAVGPRLAVRITEAL